VTFVAHSAPMAPTVADQDTQARRAVRMLTRTNGTEAASHFTSKSLIICLASLVKELLRHRSFTSDRPHPLQLAWSF
jgi:hypothetical protein